MAAATTTDAAGADAASAGEGQADVVNPIVFFDITLGGEFFFFYIIFLFSIGSVSPFESSPAHVRFLSTNIILF